MGEEHYWGQAATMKFVNILVEGQTEETFVRDVLTPYLNRKGIHPVPKLAVTKKTKKGPSFKGGIVSYAKVNAYDYAGLLQFARRFPTV